MNDVSVVIYVYQLKIIRANQITKSYLRVNKVETNKFRSCNANKGKRGLSLHARVKSNQPSKRIKSQLKSLGGRKLQQKMVSVDF